jgi:hypothetical protein
MLHDHSKRLSSLAAAVDDVLDLEEALRARQRIMPQPGENVWDGDLLRAAACTRAKSSHGRAE